MLPPLRRKFWDVNRGLYFVDPPRGGLWCSVAMKRVSASSGAPATPPSLKKGYGRTPRPMIISVQGHHHALCRAELSGGQDYLSTTETSHITPLELAAFLKARSDRVNP